MVHELCVKGKRVLIYILNSLYNHGQLTNIISFECLIIKFDHNYCMYLKSGVLIGMMN